MIITNINGGLGNQMFQYAFGAALAKAYQQPLKLSIDFFHKTTIHNGFELDKVFQLDADIINKATLSKTVGFLRSRVAVRKLLHKKQIPIFHGAHFYVEPDINYVPNIAVINHLTQYFQGYWQSFRYFEQHQALIQKTFTFYQKLDEKNQSLLKKIQATESVAVHIRRGDYLNQKALSFHGLCSDEYYLNALKIVRQKYPQHELFIFSDDADYAENVFKNHTSSSIIISHNKGSDSWKDMYLMSQCKHNIIANSTFSWWAAWLNSNPGKCIISPKQWFSTNLEAVDLLPDSWVRI